MQEVLDSSVTLSEEETEELTGLIKSIVPTEIEMTQPLFGRMGRFQNLLNVKTMLDYLSQETHEELMKGLKNFKGILTDKGYSVI